MKNQPRLANMIALREQGLTLQEIGDRYGLTRERVSQLLADTDCPAKFATKKQRRNERDDLTLPLFGKPAAATGLRSFRDGANGASRDAFVSADE